MRRWERTVSSGTTWLVGTCTALHCKWTSSLLQEVSCYTAGSCYIVKCVHDAGQHSSTGGGGGGAPWDSPPPPPQKTEDNNNKFNWGEPERAPHRRVCYEFSIYLFISLYLCIVRRAVNYFLLVFCVSLRHALIQNTNVATSVRLSNKDGDYSAR